MRFGISCHRNVIKRNIEGKVLLENTTYRVYRKAFFGLIRLYVALRPSSHWEAYNEVAVCYELDARRATSFDNCEEAKALIEALKATPDRFIRYSS